MQGPRIETTSSGTDIPVCHLNLQASSPKPQAQYSPRLADDALSAGLGRFGGAFKKEMPLILPDRFAPSVEALAYHREKIFHAA